VQANLVRLSRMENVQADLALSPVRVNLRRVRTDWSGEVATEDWLGADWRAQSQGGSVGSCWALIPKRMRADRLWLVAVWVVVHMGIWFHQI
jgi:hypothetical protein